ncbi:MAG: hypothetical protein N0C81_10095 [Candidatus Thiodiazotropha lotti]|nr:hypothetical protein [Candidatus Thiodiazotropha lotti]MCW4195569.1 hypothetical protein [Candidatus Thiodiazotropha lotti]
MNKEKGQDAWRKLDHERKKRSNMQGIAQAASEGDLNCAFEMIRYAGDYLWEANDIPDELRVYLIECFSNILNNESADKAFNLVRRRSGAPYNYWKEVRDSDIANGVSYYRDQGMTRDEAIEHVAATYTSFKDEAGCVGVDSVRKAYQRYYPSKKGKK